MVHATSKLIRTGDMGGSRNENWLEVDGRLGAGWFALRWERSDPGVPEAVYSVLLPSEGRLHRPARDAPVRPGRGQEPAPATGEELDLDDPLPFEPWIPRDEFLEELHCGLLDLAPAKRQPLF